MASGEKKFTAGTVHRSGHHAATWKKTAEEALLVNALKHLPEGLIFVKLNRGTVRGPPAPPMAPDLQESY
ncbi:hypothetical protein SBDP1_780011 [Syntrophobacter sp. SbD1]|nr:hypothetical protein SBDP1_780011 [Syntrophobacter sp. SbD1]